ncbi:hypothetical protein LshimejAT787_0403890 [Lyophyllum shimeji]|uniref:Uncharacterized protein n=1 Tax=Lyophyllum shimeji TaxID=47721 RepID=A0A9P3PKX3_LYOSH|nr:hypothetical protein LshimejAT787_0403890 [Lyophyllum shimeji]
MPRSRNAQPRAEPKPQPARTAKHAMKRPLQDITDQFVPASPGVIARPPTPKPRRGVEPRGSTLGQRPGVIAKAPVIPSSLPPSSPLSTSSGFPHAASSHYVQAMSPMPHATDEAKLDSQFDSEHGLTIGGVNATEAENPDNSDPFGFLAVERKLKALRPRMQVRETRYPSVPPSQPEPKLEVEHLQPLIIPGTPHKRGIRRAIASANLSSPDIYSGRTDSMPTTPSPSKPSSGIRKGKAVLQDEDDTDGDTAAGSLERPSMTTTSATRRKPAKRARKDEESSGRTPRRRSLRRAAVAGKARKGREDGESNAGQKRGATKKAGTKVARRKVQAKGKAKAAGNVNPVDDEQRQRWERERQERLDYFRKLQDYQMEKENVYVI